MFTIEELNPIQVSITVNGVEHTLKPFDLNVEVWVISNFSEKDKENGKDVVFKKLNNDVFDIELLKLLYVLVGGDHFLNYSNFLKALKKGDPKTTSGLIDIKNKIILTILSSQPLIKNPKREKEIMESGVVEKPCYGKYYDKFAKRYGYKIWEFYKLTLRQVHGLLKIMKVEGYKELETKAVIAGRKLKPFIQPIELSVEEEEASNNYAKKVYARMKKEYREKQLGSS